MPKRAPKYTVRTPQQEQRSRGADFLGSAFRVEDLLVINLPPDVRRRTRVSKSGKVQRRYTLEIETEPILHNLDEAELGRGPAEALAERIGANLRNAGRTCSAATKRWRKWALSRLERQGPIQKGRSKKKRSTGALASREMLRKRYDGGRIGYTPPDPNSDKLGVDSGRLADGLYASLSRTGRTTDQHATWIVNVPANRLNPETWSGGDGPQFRQWLDDFRQMANLAGAVASNEFQGALATSVKDAIGPLLAMQRQKRKQLLRAQWKVVAAGARLLAVI